MTVRRVGIVGCGQLAQMMAQEGRPLGIAFSFLAEGGENTGCVDGLGTVVHAREDADVEALYRAMGSPEVITAEREQVSVDLLRALEKFCPVYPRPDAFEKTQHRLREKTAITAAGLPVAPFEPANNYDEICAAVEKLGYPAFIKSCENGYDGKNQWRVDSDEALAAIRDEVLEQQAEQEYVVEKGIKFSREVSLIGARTADGEVRTYPLAENDHYRGTLLVSKAPAPDADEALQRSAQEYLSTLLNAWDYVGVLAMECFVSEDGLLINELAPRVHNSGHWTLAGAETSQFENHIRAILGMPLGETHAGRPAVMINMLGVDKEPTQPNEGVWLYGKGLRPGRKMGHVILLDDTQEALAARIDDMLAELYGESRRPA
ncbi:5-(carboxyamino)imidazole ribonucleotide synthase [Microbulbifer flavimaris]|uniref:N5-carboxyaminoimidazole ribonucleotide synthase n=1 Tax=Microbulbifer flavimaris TaxID=1781068 RepID=A0ABX4I084_9GAMM|nr:MULTISPECIES: 5-(carboxyamino)imidazole ribonucleotide synthase [Microbulbifer]KUJ83465.1 phosphoribosylaminoimidazole carboxylase [Microbulbifer sp. ZGT114]PCO05623.1 5-(carboxyamino)imidazole ribonucleotide synthase [Microbulbifer flavimaris]